MIHGFKESAGVVLASNLAHLAGGSIHAVLRLELQQSKRPGQEEKNDYLEEVEV